MCLPMWAGSLRAQDQPYAEYDGYSETLTFRYGAKPAGAYDLNEGNATPGWWDDRFNYYDPDERNKIRKVVFDASFAKARPTSCYMWFDRCSDLTEIEGIANLNTEEVTNMRSMFSACLSLTSLDVSHFNTQKVEDMSDMFSVCLGLKSLNVSHFDTQNVKDMSSMFYNCEGLTSLDVSKFNTQKVENMHAMFSWCEGLNSLDLSNFDTQNVTDMSRMFWGSSALTTIYVSDKFVTTKVSDGAEMFKGCTSLKGAIDFDASKTDHTYANYKTGYFTPVGGFRAYAVLEPTTGTLTFGYGAKPEGAYDLNEGANAPAWSEYGQRVNIEKVVFDASFAKARPTSCYMWFWACDNLTQIEGIEYLNTEEVTNMGLMFSGYSGLTSFDLSNFDTRNVIDMSGMFNGCYRLTSLDLSNFNTPNVENMSTMFNGCSALKTIYVSDKFVTTKVSSGEAMFGACTSLKGAIDFDASKTDPTYANYKTGYFTLKPSTAYAVFNEVDGTLTFRYDNSKPKGAYDLNEGNSDPAWIGHNIKKVVFDASFAKARPTSCRSWFYKRNNLTEINGIENLNTENVTDMNNMFMDCIGLTSLDVSHFNTQKVTGMAFMFNGCTGLESLDFSNFGTQSVKVMSYMFYGCSGLKSLDLSKFDTQNVTGMTKMFSGCTGLTSLDLSKFDTQNVESMYSMFGGCSGLKTIYVSDKFVTTKLNSSWDGSEIFSNCTSLKGAIDYDASKTDKTYANYNNGYFTPVGGFRAYAVFDQPSETLTFGYGAKPEGAYDLNEGANAPAWNDQSANINKVVFDASFAKARPASCYKWFCGCVNLAQIEGIEYLNTEEVTNMAWMFKGCSNLKSLDVSTFNTAKVKDMSYMFTHCWGLESLDVSKLNTENVTNMENMFLFCSNSKLTSLDVSNFNTEKVTNMSCMFYGSSNLTSLDLSNFNTQDVKDMSYMLKDCRGLTSLDLSGFNTPNVENMSGMFNDCYDLTTIYVSDKFVTTKVSAGTDMFYGCTSLKGAIKYEDSSYGYPEYSEGKTDHTYANYKTGYFTKLVGKNGNDKIGAVGEVLTAESLALADDKDFEAYEPFTAKTATYTRTLKEGTSWATLCLPFNVELEGQNFRAFNLLSAADGIIKLQEVETSIEAGKPVVIKMNEGENTLSFTYSGTTIAPEAQTVQASENSGYKLTGIYTQKVFDKTADNNCFIIKGGSLMNPAMVLSKTSTQIVGTKPFRAYMQEDGTEGGARAFSLSFEGEATAINTLNGVDADNAEYYDLQGRRINSLQKGINIIKHGGKATKILIR